MTPSAKMAPSKRQQKLQKAGYHFAGVWCVLFGKFAEKRSRLIGAPKWQTGDQRQLRTHAEQRWWDDEKNIKALALACRASDLERLEFEITEDFCGKLDSNEPGRTTCKDRFMKARTIAGKGKQLLIFVMRKHIYYNINDDGSIDFGGSWDIHQTI